MQINTSTNLQPSSYISNAQHVGMQREGINKTKDSSMDATYTDSVKLSTTEGPKAGAQTGMAQENGKATSTGKTKQEGGAQKTDNKEQLLLPAPKEQLLLPAPKEEHNNLPILRPDNLPVPVSPSFDEGMPGSGIGDGGNTPPPTGSNPSDACHGPELPPLPNTDYLKQLQEFQQRQHELQDIFMQMMQSELKHQQDMFKMIMDTQNAIQQSIQASLAARYASQSAILAGWSSAITGMK